MKRKPTKEELTETLKSISKTYPPKFSSSVSDVAQPFRTLIDKYPEITTHIRFLTIYVPGKSPEQMVDEILARGKRQKRKKERGFGATNRLLLEADTLLFNPREPKAYYLLRLSKNR